MSGRRLMLTCKLGPSADGACIAVLLQQYGLRTSTSGTGLVAQGHVPDVLSSMGSRDIEAHLLRRIFDAAPGTTVEEFRATILASV